MSELHDLFDRYWADRMAEYPELATMTGWLVICFAIALKLFRWR